MSRLLLLGSAGPGVVVPVPPGPAGLPAEPVPNLDTSGAVTVGTGDNLAGLVDANSDNSVFYFPNGTYTNVELVQPKDGNRFIGQSREGVTIQGSSARHKAFVSGRSNTAGAEDIVIANMTLTDFGGGTGNYDQNHGVIDGHARNDVGSSQSFVPSNIKGKDWHIHNIEIRNSSNVGIIQGSRFTITSCRFFDLNPHAIGGGFTVGLHVQGCYFYNNGSIGAPGSAANRSQVKITWNNIGPLGDSARDTTPWSGQDQAEPPQTTKFYDNVFDGNLSNLRHLWFDLDVRDTDVGWNTFRNAQTFGVFYEGCNGGHVHDNTFIDSGSWWGVTGSAYNSAGCLSLTASDNILIEDNVFDNCQGMYVFLGERGRGSGDWACGQFYPIVCDGRMTDSLAVLNDATLRSTWGTSNNTWQNNSFINGCRDVGIIRDDDMTTGELNLATQLWTGNTYDAATQAGRFWWDNTQQTYAQWQSAGRQ